MSRERRKVGQGHNLRETLEEKDSQKSLRKMREVEGEPEKCDSIKSRGAETWEGKKEGRERGEGRRGEMNIIKCLCSALYVSSSEGRPAQLQYSLDQRFPNDLGSQCP